MIPDPLESTWAHSGMPVAMLTARAAADCLAVDLTPPMVTESGRRSMEKTRARTSPLEPAMTSPRREPHTKTSPPAITELFWLQSPSTWWRGAGARGTMRRGRMRAPSVEIKRPTVRAVGTPGTGAARVSGGGDGSRGTHNDRSRVSHDLPGAERPLDIQRGRLQHPRLGRPDGVAERFREARRARANRE